MISPPPAQGKRATGESPGGGETLYPLGGQGTGAKQGPQGEGVHVRAMLEPKTPTVRQGQSLGFTLTPSSFLSYLPSLGPKTLS